MQFLSKISPHKYILAILGLAFVFRFVGIWYGLPSLYNSDEPFNVINSLAYGAKKSLEPTYFVYPSFYSYLLFAVYGLYFIFGKLFGVFENAVEFGTAYFIDPTGLFFVGRFLSVLVGVATIWLTYKIGQRFFSKRIALLASAVLGLSFTHVNLSHWILIEPTVAFMSALALYLILGFYEAPSLKSSFVAGIVSGLAISTKYNAGLILVPLLFAQIFLYRKALPELFKNLAGSVAACFIGFLLGSPYGLFSFSSFWGTLQYTFAHVSTGMVGHFTSVPLVWPLWEIFFSDWSVGVVLVAGFIYAIFQKERKQLLLLSFALSSLLFIGLWKRTSIHYLMPIYPALSILAAIFLNDILNQRLNKFLRVVLLILIFLPAAVNIVYQDIRLTHTDVRTPAKNWIEASIPDDGMIAYENYFYGPNLFDPGRFFRNSDESRWLPLEIKERLLEEKLRRVSYQLINLRKDFKLRILAKDKASGGVAKNAYVRQLLETRLPKLSAVQNARIKYVMVSSDNYDRYFKSRPPEQGTPAWLSYQNGRSFYQSVFESKELILVKEFKPSFWNLGPTVKIYKFKSVGNGSSNQQSN